MNCVKKHTRILKFVFYLLVFTVPVLVIITLSCKNTKEEIYMVTIKDDYIFEQTKNIHFTIPFYINEKYEFYFEEENIEQITLKDEFNNATYEVKIVDYQKTKQQITNQTLNLNQYRVTFNANIEVDKIMKLPKAKIIFEYKNDEKYPFEIGALTFVNQEDNNLFSLSKMKGIINNYIPCNSVFNPTTVAIILTVTNLFNVDIYLNKITLISGYGEINMNKIIYLKNNDYSYQTDINTLLGANYQLTSEEKQKNVELKINSNETITLLLPINYYFIEPILKGGIMLESTKGNQLFSVMPFFTTSIYQESYQVQRIA